MGNANNGRNVIEFQSYDNRENMFNNGTGIYINEAEIVVANIRARSSRGDEQVFANLIKAVFKTMNLLPSSKKVKCRSIS